MIDNALELIYTIRSISENLADGIWENVPAHAEGGEVMSQVKVKENESIDSALKRFKRQTSKDGVIQEVRKREHYEKPSVKRKKKSEAARKRKYK